MPYVLLDLDIRNIVMNTMVENRQGYSRHRKIVNRTLVILSLKLRKYAILTQTRFNLNSLYQL